VHHRTKSETHLRSLSSEVATGRLRAGICFIDEEGGLFQSNDTGDGGDKQAEEDFDKLTEGSSTTTYSNGTKVGELPDGTKVNVRTKSSDGRTTLEIQGTGKFKIKIRYN